MSDDQGAVDHQASATPCAFRAWWRAAVVVVLVAILAALACAIIGAGLLQGSSVDGPGDGRPTAPSG